MVNSLTMIETASRTTAALKRWRPFVVGGYVVVATAVTFAASYEPSLLSPVGIAALVLAPLAVLSGLAGSVALALPYMTGLTDADPDEYSLTWWLPFIMFGAVANAVLYLVIARAWRRRRRPHSVDGA
ncbi:hypothetical protein [Krasilnikovia sp. MM14-A1259]|uniref:hypothetical protein n=1 Tax=Krasilnikovia sp. MM14-A1259 TaxID=3373539 RepID=UPI00399D4D6E